MASMLPSVVAASLTCAWCASHPVRSCLQVQTDGTGIGADWKLDWLAVVDPSSGTVLRFPCNAWFSREAGLVRDLLPAPLAVAPDAPAAAYAVVTQTSSVRFAGTDAEVFVTLTGVRGTLAAQPLRSEAVADPFERGQRDEFIVSGTEVGDVTKVRLRTQ